MHNVQERQDVETFEKPEYEWAVLAGRLVVAADTNNTQGPGTAGAALNHLAKEGYEICYIQPSMISSGTSQVPGLAIVAKRPQKNNRRY